MQVLLYNAENAMFAIAIARSEAKERDGNRYKRTSDHVLQLLTRLDQ